MIWAGQHKMLIGLSSSRRGLAWMALKYWAAYKRWTWRARSRGPCWKITYRWHHGSGVRISSAHTRTLVLPTSWEFSFKLSRSRVLLLAPSPQHMQLNRSYADSTTAAILPCIYQYIYFKQNTIIGIRGGQINSPDAWDKQISCLDYYLLLNFFYFKLVWIKE